MNIFHYLMLQINKKIGRWLYRFRCPLVDCYIQNLIKRRGITIVHD
jgi:hypothetical protein